MNAGLTSPLTPPAIKGPGTPFLRHSSSELAVRPASWHKTDKQIVLHTRPRRLLRSDERTANLYTK